ncbi:MAG: type II toxin-antitoxin system RelE/ParE family toxin [Verrucomicrobia bacterium]|nr:type II toxin-antitoxin system RelE/ParE family toxin [Verrucomicrobiota bacterium]
MKIEVLEVARQEFDEAYVYYETQQAGLGEGFRESVKEQVQKIVAHPNAWMLLRAGIRKCRGSRFPYDVIYQKNGDSILVLALAHRKRRPLYWQDRIQ